VLHAADQLPIRRTDARNERLVTAYQLPNSRLSQPKNPPPDDDAPELLLDDAALGDAPCVDCPPAFPIIFNCDS